MALPNFICGIFCIVLVGGIGHAHDNEFEELTSESTEPKSRVLLLPFPFSSHVAVFQPIAEEFAKQGHEAYTLLPSSFSLPEIDRSTWNNLITWHCEDKEVVEIETRNSIIATASLEARINSKSYMKKTQENIQSFCSTFLLTIDDLFNELSSLKFDIVFVDNMIDNECLYLIPYRLSLPVVTISDRLLQPWTARLPYLPSFNPYLMLPLSDKMSFFQRVQNFMAYLASHTVSLTPQMPSEIVQKFSKEGEEVDVHLLARQSVLWVTSGDVVLDYPKPVMPHVIEAGGLTTRPAKDLPAQWRQIMDPASFGVIIISLGPEIVDIPKNIVSRFIKAFSAVTEQVVWKFHNKNNLTLPYNVLVADWLPLNDLLGHVNTKLFITSGHTNNLFEAMYHGVPFITFPLFGNSPYNSRIVVDKGYGIELDLRTFTPTDLVRAIKEILTSPAYSTRVAEASEIYRHRPETASQLVTSRVQEVLTFGSSHLKSPAADMPLYQFIMLDVISLLFVLILVAIVMFKWVIMLAFNLFLTTDLTPQKLKSQ